MVIDHFIKDKMKSLIFYYFRSNKFYFFNIESIEDTKKRRSNIVLRLICGEEAMARTIVIKGKDYFYSV